MDAWRVFRVCVSVMWPVYVFLGAVLLVLLYHWCLRFCRRRFSRFALFTMPEIVISKHI